MGLHEILPSGSGKNRAKLLKDIEEYHITYAIDFDDADIDTFIARRPDGLAFDKEEKQCFFLEYTRAMDTTEDWAERKEQEKNDKYSSLLVFINHLSHREKSSHAQGVHIAIYHWVIYASRCVHSTSHFVFIYKTIGKCNAFISILEKIVFCI